MRAEAVAKGKKLISIVTPVLKPCSSRLSIR